MSDHDEAVALVDEMPLPKKIVLLYGDGDWQTNAIEGTSIKALEFHDGPNGLRKPIREKVPRGLFVAPSEKTTCFPSPCLLACSWDPEVTKQIGEAIAKECLNHGLHRRVFGISNLLSAKQTGRFVKRERSGNETLG